MYTGWRTPTASKTTPTSRWWPACTPTCPTSTGPPRPQTHKSEYFWDNQTHQRPEGEQAYLDMIARADAAVVVENGGSVVAR